MKSIRVQASPSYYACEPGIFERLEPLMIEGKVKNGLMIHGSLSLKSAQKYLPSFEQVDMQYERYRGECSNREIERVSSVAYEKRSDVIIGLGGGKVMDLAKAVANHLDLPVILLPTLASTCAAWTPLSVIYTDNGDYLKYKPYIKNPWIVLVEPAIIAQSPASYLRAGIGDTLAKWYEAKALTKQLDQKRVPVLMSLRAASLCKELILSESEKAIASLQEETVTHSLLTILESSILAGGLVGGLGDEYGRIAAAHSVHNALTQFSETHAFLHGEKVAYGILVQVAIEKDFTELETLRTFYKTIALPSSLEDLGLENSMQVINRLAELTLAPHESIHFMAESFSIDEVVHGIQAVEAYTKK